MNPKKKTQLPFPIEPAGEMPLVADLKPQHWDGVRNTDQELGQGKGGGAGRGGRGGGEDEEEGGGGGVLTAEEQ